MDEFIKWMLKSRSPLIQFINSFVGYTDAMKTGHPRGDVLGPLKAGDHRSLAQDDRTFFVQNQSR